MIWFIINLLISISVAVYALYMVRRARVLVEESHQTNLVNAQAELETKKKFLESIAVSVPGLISLEDVENYKESLVQLENLLNVEKGKCSITEAEIDALDVRLREIEELRRELEVSNMDAIKEVEMLRAQERDMSNQNQAIKDQLQSSLEQVDILLDVLHNNAEAVAQLNKSKNEIIEIDKKIIYYEEAIAKINQQYVGLKRAYDALDIEYAQLYEKRQLELEESGESS